MRDEPSRIRTYASWADHIFNPWISSSRCLGSAFNVIGSFRWASSIGRLEDALSWELRADLFAALHKRRPRVFAGPWCWALSADSGAADLRAFGALIERTPSLEWFVLAKNDDLRHFSTLGRLGLPAEKLWVGVKLDDPRTHQEALDALRSCPAKYRFAVAKPSAGDFGDLDLSDIDWVIISIDADEILPEPDWMASIKLQAMGYGIPVWFDTPSANVLDGAASPFAVREEPRRKR